MRTQNWLMLTVVALTLLACSAQIPSSFSLGSRGGSTVGTGGGNTGGDTSDNTGGDTNGNTGGGTTTPAGPKTVVFEIAPGTGNGPWNSPASPITVTVGDTIRFQNNSGINMSLHSPGTGAGLCPHQSGQTPSGGFYDCRVTQPFQTSAANAQTYNHNVGPSAAVYIVVKAATP